MQKRVKAILLIVSGPVLLVGILIAYAVVNFVVSAAGANAAVVGNIINVVLSLAGILGLLLVIIGIPVGIVLLIMNLGEGKSQK